MVSTLVVAFVGYLLLMFVIGFVALKFQSNTEEGFFLADRKLGKVAIGLSAGASGSSGWYFIGAAGLAYTQGIATMWMLPGMLAGYLLTYIFIAPRLRRYTKKRDIMTLPGLLESRFNDSTHAIRFTGAMIILIFFITYIAGQFIAAGKAFEVVFNIDYTVGVFIAVGLTTLYCLIGGFQGVVWTDVLQALLFAIVLAFLPLAIIFGQLGGWNSFINQVGQANTQLLNPAPGSNWFAILGFISGLAGIGLGYPGQPHILQRFIGAKNDKDIESAMLITMVWLTIIITGANLLGMIGRLAIPPTEIADPENIVPLYILTEVPPVIGGIILAAIFAAVMSTVDSQIMVISQSMTTDIYHKTLEKNLNENRFVWIGRAAIAVSGALSLIIAIWEPASVFWLVLYAYAGVGAALGPPVVASLYWARATKWGALAGMVVGLVSVIIWSYLPVVSTIYELAGGFVASSLAVYIVSVITDPQEASLEEAQLATSQSDD